MSRHIAVPLLLIVMAVCAANGMGGAPKVSPQDLWWQTINPTYTGWIHNGCVEFADPEDAISKGPITRMEVYHGGLIHGIRLWYGSDGVGNLHGYTEGIPMTGWQVPEGEKITRVEGEIAGYYISRLQFFTDGGHSSPPFGEKRGKPFVVSDPANGALRTISGWANLRRHPSLNRAIASLTFQFGAPYFIKNIEYDTAALDAKRMKTAPERCAGQDFTNETSLEQTSTYTNSVTVVKTTTLTFEQSFGLKLGVEVWGDVSAKLLGVGLGAGGAVTWETSATATSGQSYTNSRQETVSWSVPVRVPPQTRVVANSTWRKYRVSIPFTYTVAWYEGSKDNIKKEVTLPGLYEDVRVDDLKHDFKEVQLER